MKIAEMAISCYVTACYGVLMREGVHYTSEGGGRGIADRVDWEGDVIIHPLEV